MKRFLLILGAVFAVACGGAGKPSNGGNEPPVQGAESVAQVPDFSLQDQNPNSQTFGMNVSPRDLLGQVTAWYFGHVT